MAVLIEPESLVELLGNDDICLLDVRFSLADPGLGRRLYQQGHIPGAIYASLEDDLSGAVIPGITGRHPLPERHLFLEILRHWGISKKSHIVIYDTCDHAVAARAWWLLRWMGLDRVSVLHGGFVRWEEAGLPLDSEILTVKPGSMQMEPEAMPVVSADEILADMASGSPLLIDARSQERFSGMVEPMDPKAGHIPGAVCHPFTTNMDEKGRFLPPEQLRKMFDQLLNHEKNPVFYCGSGVTACHNIFSMEYAGMGTGRLYPGSWSEWIASGERPVELSRFC